jgi:hypothetical protein
MLTHGSGSTPPGHGENPPRHLHRAYLPILPAPWPQVGFLEHIGVDLLRYVGKVYEGEYAGSDLFETSVRILKQVFEFPGELYERELAYIKLPVNSPGAVRFRIVDCELRVGIFYAADVLRPAHGQVGEDGDIGVGARGFAVTRRGDIETDRARLVRRIDDEVNRFLSAVRYLGFYLRFFCIVGFSASVPLFI